ncbi:MAG: CHAP domain-containing protein [Flavobacterium sp.]|nr:CHAP domain-containing protein [Flavobacterium sp.]
MSKIVDIATREIGNGENPLNSNNSKYNAWFQLPGVPWCGIFVSWCYSYAGKPLPKIGFNKGFAGCQTAVAYFKTNKKITTAPTPGSIVFYDWNADGRFDHTGIFVGWLDDGRFEAIEGNTSLSNQSNGGTVMKRIRSNKNVIFVTL